MREAVVPPLADALMSDTNFLRRSGCAVQRNFHVLPPRLKCILLDATRHRHGAIRNLAGIVDAQNLALLVGKRVAVILVERATAIIACGTGGEIDAQFERPARYLIRVLHQWLQRHTGPGARRKSQPATTS